MTLYKSWVNKQRGKPVWLLLTGVGLISFVYIGYSKIWSPYRLRKRREIAATYGSFLYEHEKKKE